MKLTSEAAAGVDEDCSGMVNLEAIMSERLEAYFRLLH